MILYLFTISHLSCKFRTGIHFIHERTVEGAQYHNSF